MCWCHYLLCTLAEVEPVVLFVVVFELAGSVFWRPAEEVTVDAVLETLELIKSSCLLPKEPLKERHIQWMHLYHLSLLIKTSQSCEGSIKFLPMYSVAQFSLGKFWGKRSIFFIISLTRTFNLWLQKAAEMSLSPDHCSTKRESTEWNLTGLCKAVLITPTVFPFLNCCFPHTEYLRKCRIILHSLPEKKMSSISLLLQFSTN